MDNQKIASTDDDQLLTLKEVLELVRHKKSWLHQKINDGVFPPGFKIGRRRFWWRSEVEAARRRLLVPARPPKEKADVPPSVTQSCSPPPKGRQKKPRKKRKDHSRVDSER